VDDIVVLLTATVDVGDVVLIERRNRELRIRDYQAALARWCTASGVTKVVMGENSGFDLEQLIPAQKTVDLELISYKEAPFLPELGKGFGELSTIRHVLKHSRSIRSESFILKVTGRYFVENISAVVQHLSESPPLATMCDFSRNLTFCDSRVFGGSVEFLQGFLCPLIGIANDSAGVYIEHCLARAGHSAIAAGLRWGPPPCWLDIRGISGTGNYTYSASLARRLYRQFRLKLKRHLLAK